ncbi:hypothetical protein RGQ29_006635 [Quercus rubra]|uniref:DUF4220 domain-containing protein n=1 Tax=Quercus rubra TaxID=3512 RepID=A0AAN7IC80_QUERU|nr:hypothetical protein RGQ29_006635 [Quercus rubra]
MVRKKRLMELFPPRWRNLWSEWQLRVLILLSLTSQIILVILGNRRKYISGPWIRLIVWSTYLLADSIAIMAAGIITNDMGEVYNDNGLVDTKYELITFWAPLLLLHLGGTDTITAYSLEDNELWKRHSLGVVIHAIATVYIWLTAWTSSRLSLLFALMFSVGLVKYCERVWVLFLASEKRFRDSIPDTPTNDSKIMEKCKLKLFEGYHLTTHQVFEVQVPDHSAGTTSNESNSHAHELLTAYSLLEMVKRLFADLILGFQDRDASREIFKRLSVQRAFNVIEIELGFIYDLLYTKAKVIYSPWGIARRIVGILIILTVLVLFVTLKERHHHSKIDIIITLVLLVVALLLELYAFRELLLSDQTAHWLIKHEKPTFLPVINSTLRCKWHKRRRWSNSVSQFSLLSFSLGKAPLPYYGILKMSGIGEMLEIQPYDIPQQDIPDIKYLIFCEIKGIRDWAEVNNYDTDLKALYGHRGGRTLERYKRGDLAWSVEKGFDQSVLIWHLATEICYFRDYIKPDEIETWIDGEGKRNPINERSAIGLQRQRCNYLSRYMLYLLVRCPNMLPIGMGHIKFQDIYTEVGEFIEEHTGKSVGDEEEASKTLSKVKTDIMLTVGGKGRSNNLIFYACKLASSLGPGKEKWDIIKNVWLEMLGHAASQCKGRLHAQQLRRGGELLTHVWLLMAHFGLTDHFQISHSHAIAEVILR